jgi:feruloyl esterase
MQPGVMHCLGGPGPDSVDWFAPIAEWVERDRAPERVIAHKMTREGTISNARPLCPYPQRARYDGKGDPMDAASYACR